MLGILGVVASFTSWFKHVFLTGVSNSLWEPFWFRRSQGTGSSPVCLWPPSIHLCRRRCFLLWNHPSSSQTTAAGSPQCLVLMKKEKHSPTPSSLWKTGFHKWDNPSEKLHILQEMSVKAEINCKSLHKVQKSGKVCWQSIIRLKYTPLYCP